MVLSLADRFLVFEIDLHSRLAVGQLRLPKEVLLLSLATDRGNLESLRWFCCWVVVDRKKKLFVRKIRIQRYQVPWLGLELLRMIEGIDKVESCLARGGNAGGFVYR